MPIPEAGGQVLKPWHELCRQLSHHMDIARPDLARARRRRRLIYGCIGLFTVAVVTLGLSRLQPAAPSVEKSGLYTDTVKRGEMLLRVRGNGSLLPEEIRWVPALSAGRIERINVLPGAAVQADAILVELSNPELEQGAFDAAWAVKVAESQLAKLRVQLQSDRLAQEATAASLESDLRQSSIEADADEQLQKRGLVATLTAKRSRSKADELHKRLEIEQKRLEISVEATRANLAAQDFEVAKLKAQLALRQQQVESLKVRSGINGVLQKLGDILPLQVGQQVAAGANLARVANPARLKAEIKVAETQAKDIQLGQLAQIDTRNGVISGKVVRIDPAVQNGTVSVDVALEGALPRGARPDLSVDGTIELERLDDVVNVGRPVNGQPDTTVGLFKLVDGGRSAVRVTVKLGRTSVGAVEVLEGLVPGEVVVLSDMSQWDGYQKVRLD